MENRDKFPSSPCLKIVLYGPESTGKTTLAKALADHYQTTWVPEFARKFLQDKWNRLQQQCTLDDLHTIAKGQIQAEENAQVRANRLLFCDTNILVTKVWSETHFEGYCAPELLKILEQRPYDFYLLTETDVPWEKDDLRDRPQQREEMFSYFKQQLDHFNLPYLSVRGTPQARLQQATQAIDNLLPSTQLDKNK